MGLDELSTYAQKSTLKLEAPAKRALMAPRHPHHHHQSVHIREMVGVAMEALSTIEDIVNSKLWKQHSSNRGLDIFELMSHQGETDSGDGDGDGDGDEKFIEMRFFKTSLELRAPMEHVLAVLIDHSS